jgi:transposase
MTIEMDAAERDAVQKASRAAPRVRQWRRYQALLLLAEGRKPREVATALDAALSSVYNWAAAWRRAGMSGLAEGVHAGMARRFDAAGERWLDATLARDPQACGYQAAAWTVPLLRREAAHAGYAVSEQTVRRAIRRLGWRGKRPKYVLGRPDPEYAEKKRP